MAASRHCGRGKGTVVRGVGWATAAVAAVVLAAAPPVPAPARECGYWKRGTPASPVGVHGDGRRGSPEQRREA